VYGWRKLRNAADEIGLTYDEQTHTLSDPDTGRSVKTVVYWSDEYARDCVDGWKASEAVCKVLDVEYQKAIGRGTQYGHHVAALKKAGGVE
jgi:hypothetical protein